MDGFAIIDEKFRHYVLPNAQLEKLGDGYRWLEGPVWFADMGCLLVSDLPNDRILRWTEDGGVSVFRKPSRFANGHARDKQGRLIGCSHQDRCITRTEFDGTVTILVDRYKGKRLNSPNDVVVRSDGTVWFTDPVFGINTDYEGGKQSSENACGVYCFDPGKNALARVIEDIEGPNGLCFSPDEKLLYVVESGAQFSPAPKHGILVYDVDAANNTPANGRLFYKSDNGQADGLRMDVDGNVWAAAGDGVHCISQAGELLGKVLVPHRCSNITFGGRYNSRLFICGSHTLYALYTNTRGVKTP